MPAVVDEVIRLTKANHQYHIDISGRITSGELGHRKNAREITELKRRTDIIWDERENINGYDYILKSGDSFSDAMTALGKIRNSGVQGALRLYIDRWEWSHIEVVNISDLHIHVSDSAMFFCSDPGVSFLKITVGNVTIEGGRFIYRVDGQSQSKNVAISSTGKNTVVKGMRVVNPRYPYAFTGVESESGCSYQFTTEDR